MDSNSIGIVEVKTITLFEPPNVLRLDCGRTLGPIQVAYETYGTLTRQGDNVVLVCHALSGDAHLAGYHSPEDRKPGWWDNMVGPGKGIDTDRYFVICTNVLGGCKGTTGPGSINPETGKPWGLDFPVITIGDMVRVQKALLDALGIKRVLAVIGGSMGGMQVLDWAIRYPDVVVSAIPIATTARLTAQGIAFNAVGRNAILADPHFNNGQYYDTQHPARGLSIARMIGHITYLSEQSMHQKFGRKLMDAENYSYDFDSEFAVETYLDHQGQRFVERFDANSYLYITKAIDYFDLAATCGSLENAFADTRCRYLIASFSSDWLFPPSHSRQITEALLARDKDVSYCNVMSTCGHDAFLLPDELPVYGEMMRAFLENVHDGEPELTGDDDLYVHAPTSIFGPLLHRRLDYDQIVRLIQPGASVLDLGCGRGSLLLKLRADGNRKLMGLELNQEDMIVCLQRGLDVVQADLNKGLAAFAIVAAAAGGH
jgi:homoserine O-acetyltransferase